MEMVWFFGLTFLGALAGGGLAMLVGKLNKRRQRQEDAMMSQCWDIEED